MAFDKEVLARNIKAFRAIKGWSQSDLSEHSSVGINSITDYETGETCPRLDKASQIADALGVSIDALVSDIQADELASTLSA